MAVESGGTSPVLLLGAMIGLLGLALLIFMLTLGVLRGRDRGQAGVGQRKSGRPAPVPEDAPSGAATRQGEVMRVLRNSENGRVLVEVGGRRFEHIREIEDPQVGRRVLWAIADLVRFTGGMATNPRAVRSASEGMDWDEDAKTAASGWTVLGPVPASISSEAGAGVASTANLGQTMGEFFRRGLTPASSSTAAPEPGSFIDQIEAILQARLQAFETPLSYEVHVSAGPEPGLRIQVGRAFYGSVDEVPDPQARALIREAVQEWERRQADRKAGQGGPWPAG